MPFPSPSLFPSESLIPDGDVNVYDYEAPNGAEVTYRVRARHDFDDGGRTVSDWVESNPVSWSGTAFWLKHPTRPSLNTTIELNSPAADGVHAQARQGVFQPLGSTEAIVVMDEDSADTGTIRVRADDEAARAALDALRQLRAPLLLQLRSGDNAGAKQDRWIAIGDRSRERVVDGARFPLTWDEYAWTEVPRPTGALAEGEM